MKKLFAVALSALALLGVTACGGSEEAGYDETVREATNGTVHALGNFTIGEDKNVWDGTDSNKMTAISVKQVSELSTEVADKLNKIELDWIYSKEIKMVEGVAQWGDPLTLIDKDGNFVDNADGCYAIKAGVCSYDAEDESYSVEQWIPNPNDGKAAHIEALTNNIFVPPYQEAEDEHGFSWASNPALNTLEEGTYTFVVAKYKAQSDNNTVGYGFAMFKKA